MPARHRSMRAVFEYAWQQLTSDEQNIFQQLSVFRGSVTREAAAFVTGHKNALVVLAALQDRSLVRMLGRGRYQVHDLLRQYGAEKLAERSGETQTLARHSAYYCELLETAAPALKGTQHLEMMQAIRHDRENILRAGGGQSRTPRVIPLHAP